MKRLLNKRSSALLVLMSSFVLSSCLKNNKYYVDFGDYKASIELPLASKYANIPFGVNWSPDTTTSFKVYVNVASMDKPTSPVTATLGLDLDYITQYNSQQAAAAVQAQQDYLSDPSHSTSDAAYPYPWTPMEILPDSLYELSIGGKPVSVPFDLTVAAGQRQAFADLLIHTDKFPPGHNYVLPFTINKAPINISSWNHLALWFITSPFTGNFPGYHSKVLGGIYDAEFDDPSMTLSTVDQHTVAQDGSIGDWFGGYTEYHFLGDGSVQVKAGSSSGSPNSYGAQLITSSSDASKGEFYVEFTILSGKYHFWETFNR